MPAYVSLINWTDQGIKNFRDTVRRAEDFRADLAGTLWKVGGRADFSATVYLLLGRPVDAERVLRRSWELLGGVGGRGGPPAMLAQAIFVQGGRDEEAE